MATLIRPHPYPLPKGEGVLVTGGAGFIGSHVVDELVKLGLNVVVIDDLSGGFRDNVNAKATWIKGSVTDAATIDRLFKKHRFDYVFHLAAYAAEGLSHFIKRFNYENNLIGSVNLINASIKAKVKCFVFTSSIAVYGKNQLPMKESLVPRPEDPYGIAKWAVEQELEASRSMFGLNYIVFRPHNVYGERQNIADRYRNVIGIFMNQAMKGEPMTIFGNGEQKRAFSYIGDIAPIIAGSIYKRKAYNQVFNVGADVPYSVNKLTRIICDAMATAWKVRHLPARHEVQLAYSSHAKARNYFGKQKMTSLEDGIARMAAWAKRVGPRPSSRFKNIEILEKLPPSWR